MNTETEKRILELARRIEAIDREIVKSIAKKGSRDHHSSKEFYSLRDELKELLGEALALNLRDPKAISILRKVREGNYFYLDKEEKKISDAIKNLPPEQLKIIYEMLELDKERFASEFDTELYLKFDEEIKGNVTPEDYYERKNTFSTLIVGTRLPDKMNDYFDEIRQCFLFGIMYAAIGLCRVLIEIGFRKKYDAFGLSKKSKSTKTTYMEDYKMHEVIRKVCKNMKANSLKEEAEELYGTASNILHGRDIAMELKDDEVLQFIHRTFKLIENLYDLH